MRMKAFGRWVWLLPAFVLTSGCEIRTGSAPSPRHAQPAPAQPAGQPAPAAAQPGPQSERTALHASVAAEVATVRGLAKVIGIALSDASLALGPRVRRAHETGSPKARAAQQQLNSGQHLAAHKEAHKAAQLLQPAVDELADKPRLPEPVRQPLEGKASESRDATGRAVVAIRNTGQTAGLEQVQQAEQIFGQGADTAQRGDGSRALRLMTRAYTILARGVVTRFPALR